MLVSCFAQDGFYSVKLVYKRAQGQGFIFTGTVGTYTQQYTGPIPLNSKWSLVFIFVYLEFHIDYLMKSIQS